MFLKISDGNRPVGQHLVAGLASFKVYKKFRCSICNSVDTFETNLFDFYNNKGFQIFVLHKL